MARKRSFTKSFASAASGIWYAARREKHIRVHYIIAALTLAFGLVLGVDQVEDWAILTVIVAVVIVAEMINTAVEIIVATVVKDNHPEIGQALDICAGAVLMAALLSVVVGLLILGPKLYLTVYALLWG